MKRIFEFALVLVLLALMVSSVAVVGASDSQAVNGTWQIASVIPISAQPVAGNCIIEAVAISSLQGDLTGTFTDNLRIVRQGACDQLGSETFLGHGTFEGSAADASGTFDFTAMGTADPQGNLQGQFVIQGGSGELANLHGVITLTGSLISGGGTYSGNVHFD
jgi:hypothetical protein